MNSAQHTVHILEEERRRFARDLHDGPVQVLSNTSMRLDMLSQLLQVDASLAEDEIRRMRRRLVQATIEIRQLIYDLQPVAVDAMGLGAALTGLVRRIEKDWSVPITVTVIDDGPTLPTDQGIMLYRAVQEALTNAAKHSAAQSIDVRLEQRRGYTLCRVSDNGQGFDPGDSSPGHYGLGNMIERMALVGGTVALKTGHGQGTQVTFTINDD